MPRDAGGETGGEDSSVQAREILSRAEQLILKTLHDMLEQGVLTPAPLDQLIYPLPYTPPIHPAP